MNQVKMPDMGWNWQKKSILIVEVLNPAITFAMCVTF